MPVRAQPDVRAFAPAVQGKVVAPGDEAAGARIKVYYRNNVVASTTADAEGDFALNTLPVPQQGFNFAVMALPAAPDSNLAPAIAFMAPVREDDEGDWPELLKLELHPRRPTVADPHRHGRRAARRRARGDQSSANGAAGQAAPAGAVERCALDERR